MLGLKRRRSLVVYHKAPLLYSTGRFSQQSKAHVRKDHLPRTSVYKFVNREIGPLLMLKWCAGLIMPCVSISCELLDAVMHTSKASDVTPIPTPGPGRPPTGQADWFLLLFDPIKRGRLPPIFEIYHPISLGYAL